MGSKSSGGGAGTGGKKPGEKSASQKFRTDIANEKPIRFKWESRKTVPTYDYIREQYAEELFARKLINSQASDAALEYLATNKWISMNCDRQIKKGELTWNGKSAISQKVAADKCIMEAYRLLGIYPMSKKHPAPPEDESIFDEFSEI